MTRGEHMRKARKRAGLTIEQLASRAGCAKNTIARCETQNKTMRIDTIELCADVLGISLDEYVGHEVSS